MDADLQKNYKILESLCFPAFIFGVQNIVQLTWYNLSPFAFFGEKFFHIESFN